ncbi:DUF6922 domain-containing protein [Dyadobacter sp. LHD-138]|uniref:helix-turn-helix transcriptional regulator n=1 Tax=Dyadobacter sp. LHD-138 TaxID=3071413 RepID=UPI0027E18BBE|nr:plasmid maintenance system antidote protein [Dyadobacter sp. LHD-138]MDQ6481668.1 plasmid maintenance system antidote protein [Dyadobacter sp. LHD-138]
MENRFEKYRGIHPGIVLERELKKRSLKQRPFAMSISEYPQSFNAIIKGKRSITTSLALRIEKELDLEEGVFVMLQAFFDIRKEKERQINLVPNLSILRKALFWDTDISRIDWEKQATAVIRRVFERGNDEEKEEITRFYGKVKIQSVLVSEKRKPLSLHKQGL